jgi:Flp pilus assembly protein TadD
MTRWILIGQSLALVGLGALLLLRDAPGPATRNPAPVAGVAGDAGPRDAAPEVPPPLPRCTGDATGADEAPAVEDLLDRAAEHFQAGEVDRALVCAEAAARREPGSVIAHHHRATCLAELGRPDAAREAFLLALALDPGDPETLAGLADLYLNVMPQTAEGSAIGLALARQGTERLGRGARADADLTARLALLEGQALLDLGQSPAAVIRLEAAQTAAGTASALGAEIRYPLAVALFEVGRFAEARVHLDALRSAAPDDAGAWYHLGLVLERLGDEAGARRALAEAARLDPEGHPLAPEISAASFQAVVQGEIGHLPRELLADLARVRLELADLPEPEDLSAVDPPLSPTIVGLFRGLPLGPDDPDCSEPRSIVLYRRNLARIVRTPEELRVQVRITLLHELGHLRGDDDEELRARGLE